MDYLTRNPDPKLYQKLISGLQQRNPHLKIITKLISGLRQRYPHLKLITKIDIRITTKKFSPQTNNKNRYLDYD